MRATIILACLWLWIKNIFTDDVCTAKLAEKRCVAVIITRLTCTDSAYTVSANGLCNGEHIPRKGKHVDVINWTFLAAEGTGSRSRFSGNVSQQEGYLCAQHCLNALLQGPYFNAVDLASFGHQMDEEERIRMAESGVDSEDYKLFLEVKARDIFFFFLFFTCYILAQCSQYESAIWNYKLAREERVFSFKILLTLI